MRQKSQILWMSLASVVLLSSCASTTKTNTFWTSGFKTEASAGAGKMETLNIHKGDNLDKGEWENFYAPIQGFQFEEGLMQKIEVKETPIEKSKVPADASSIHYELVKVIEKQKDTRLDINGDWILSSLNNGPINRMVVLPTLKIDLKKMQLSANGGCNYLSGGIESITKSTITLSPMISTLKACAEENIESEFALALNEIKSYEVKNSTLTFMNEKGDKVLTFIKGQPNVNAPHQLHDIWAVTKINGNAINTKHPVPDMEINLTTMKIMGTDGCNRYNGSIENVSDSKIQFGPVASTRMMCEHMESPNQFNGVISKITSYKIDQLKLMFFDEEGKEILTLKKVD